MNRRWVVRLLFALGAGLLLAWLPSVLTQGVGPTSLDLSSRLGLSSGVGASTFAILFAAGVLTSLTPCVYPLIPITVSVFGARSREHRARSAALSATYVGGIAVTYSGLGIFAALSGRAFGSALSSPWVVAVLAGFLLILAASMFGAFEMTLPASLEARRSLVRGGGFAPAFWVGLLAGGIAPPRARPLLARGLTF